MLVSAQYLRVLYTHHPIQICIQFVYRSTELDLILMNLCSNLKTFHQSTSHISQSVSSYETEQRIRLFHPV
jgi:hypothetical protein